MVKAWGKIIAIMNNITEKFLISFFLLFQAHIEEFRIKDNKIIGIIARQNDEDKQYFSWTVNFNKATLIKLNLLCEFLLEHNLMQGDRIIVSPSELKILLQNNGWSMNEIEMIIDNLCSVEIKMIDNEEETDSFFVHF